MILITGHPRSGTKYMSWLMSIHGLHMPHEGNTQIDSSVLSDENCDGLVSYKHICDPQCYDLIIHQVRHPLKVISSACTCIRDTFHTIYAIIGEVPYDTAKTHVLRVSMWTWLNFNKYIEQFANWRFRIENLKNVYPELCKKLNVKAFDELPPIPTNHNTRQHKDYTWLDLMSMDSELAEQIREKAEEYGYDVHNT